MRENSAFQVLSRGQKIHRHYLLEASAGTGKTYSIENLFLRLLLESCPERKEPFKLDEILTVTFTNAAVQDLKARIRSNLEKALQFIHKGEELPDFLLAIKEKGPEFLLDAKLKIEEALFHFDRSSIFTIHGFCYKTLQEHAFEGRSGFQPAQSMAAREELLEFVENFFHTELKEELFSPAQLEIVIKKQKGAQKLKSNLLSTIQKGIEILPTPSFKACFEDFAQEIARLKLEGLQKEKLLEEFLFQAPQYKKICNNKGEPHEENLLKVLRFAALFEKKELKFNDFDSLVKDGLYLTEALDPVHVKSKARMKHLHYPNLCSLLSQKLLPIVEGASSYSSIYARLAEHCRRHLFRYLEENEKMEFSYLLHKMLAAVSKDSFRDSIRGKYSAVIIDEFQDTDPQQWQIFHKLFLDGPERSPFLYLVGDPKQSIYAFRNADIYTYLNAERALGEKCKYSLDTNFRSSPRLIKALNLLFDESQAPGWIALPYLTRNLPYMPIQASPAFKDWPFKDQLGAVHFCAAAVNADKKEKLEEMERACFFPYFSQEIKRLNVLEKIPLKQMAILVKDRFQAMRLKEFLKKEGIATALQRPQSLSQSPALNALSELLASVLQPNHEGKLKAALGGKIINAGLERVKSLEDDEKLAQAVATMAGLKEVLIENGFGQFFNQFLDTVWISRPLREEILSRESGEALYSELHQAAGLLLEQESSQYAPPESLCSYLEELMDSDDFDEEGLKIDQDLTYDAVNVLTTFSSKGLEYGVVFALGVVNRSAIKEDLAILREGSKPKLASLPLGSKEYALHLDEIDAEKMRQFYVALTRAKYRVYVPLLLGISPPKRGTASPMELFLARLKDSPSDLEGVYRRMGSLNSLKLESLAKESEGSLTISHLTEGTYEPLDLGSKEKIQWRAPQNVSFSYKPLYSFSFSSICTSRGYQDKLKAPRDFCSTIKTAHALPSGSDTGNLLHGILENLSFDMAEGDFEKAVLPFTRNTPFQEWNAVIAELVSKALAVPLGEDKVRLRDLKPGEFFKEMEFLFPDGLVKDLPDCKKVAGFMNGVVDLAFHKGGKYYLVDWKSNWLGPDDSAYSQEGMREAMAEHRYDLQAEIYTKAFAQYISLFDPRPFKDCFEGVFYLFLRGLNPDSLKQNGIYRFFPGWL